MKKTSFFLTSILATGSIITNAQSNLLEHIPTNEFAVVTFDGASITAKSSDLSKLAMYDSITNQFDRLIADYKQALIDENTSVSDAEVEILREEVDDMVIPPPPPQPEPQIKAEIIEEEVEVATEEVESAEKAYDSYDYNYEYNYKPTPRLTIENIFGALVSNGHAYGLSTNKDYFFTFGMNDSINHSALIFSKSDQAKFDQLINNIIPTDQKEQLITLNNNYHYYKDEDILLAWNNDIVTFIDYKIPYRYRSYSYNEETTTEDNYYESYQDRLEAEAKKKEAEKKAKIESVLNSIFNTNPQHSLKYNTNYKKSLIEKGDISYFINAMGGNTDFYFKAYKTEKTDNFLSLFKDNFTYGALNFNTNDIEITSTQHVGAHYLNQIKEMNKKKFNKAMYKYIDGKNLIGIAGFAANPEPAYEIYKDTYINILSNMDLGEEWIGTAAEIGFTFFDEEELFDLIQGDFVFALTDIKEFEVEYTSYDYDENYNRVETTKTKKETLPEFVSLATIGNKALRDKIIKLMNQTDVIRKKGNYYELQEPKSRYSDRAAKPLNVFYMLKGDLLIVTNDEQLLIDNDGNGLPKSQQLNGEALKLMKTNNMFAYWTPKATYDKIPQEFQSELQPLEVAANTYQSFIVSGVKNKGNLFTSTGQLNLVESEQNALMHSLEIIQSLIESAGRF
ncbi:MAG: hypothetical protein N4A35_11645 [Flavobacteriales bacterium]|jgi:hypothetical protein|nr:hypothetical protein [Flavobacteriales bacterium]